MVSQPGPEPSASNTGADTSSTMTMRSVFSKLYRPCPLIGIMILIIIVVLLVKPGNVNVTPAVDPYWRIAEYAQLSVGDAFDNLSAGGKSFVRHLNKAAWFGSFISAAQTSPESPCLMLIVLKALQMGLDSKMEKAGFSEGEKMRFRQYSCGILANQGNYRGDDSFKFVPENISVAKMDALFEDVWPLVPKHLSKRVFSVNPAVLGFPPEGQTQYWRGMNSDEAESAVRFLQSKGIMIGNQFAKMKTNASGRFLDLRFGSQLKTTESWRWRDFAEGQRWEGFAQVSLSRGAYSGILTLIIKELEQALPHADNERITKFLQLIIESLTSGDLRLHVDAGKEWVKALHQKIETYLGFQENYRDPKNLQLEYCTFVGIEDSAHSKAFRTLTEKSAALTSRLPWGKEFEPDSKDQADSKSFSSLLVTSYVANIPPRGVNLPDYEEVKLVGQKNFNIANVVEGKAKFLVLAFLNEEDGEILRRLYVEAFTIKLGIHELLGHGSGLLLRKDEMGKSNFNESLLDPTTNSKISHWYTPGKTFASVFGSIAAAYEETRANSIALYLACDPEILAIFGHERQAAHDVCLAVYLNQVFTGLTSLAYYDAKAGWLSAHAQSEYVILKALMEALPDLVKIEESGKEDIEITINRALIPNATTSAFRDFVQKIQIYRLTANNQEAERLFKKHSEVDARWSRLRGIVMAKKAGLIEPSFVQGNIQPRGDEPIADYKWVDYNASCEGLLQSWTERFSLDEVQAIQSAVEEYVEDDG